ncbi:MAG: hypothetical protein ACI9FB_002077 [Candidatus Azotimanducaceae bacterium]|jgi:hypothetical protein
MPRPKFPYWRLDKQGADDHELQDRIQKVYDIAKGYRSEIVDASTLVELQLNQVLSDAFIGNRAGLQHQFKAQILSAEFCSFFQKWKLLRTLINSNTVWWQTCKPDCHDQQVKKLKNLISHRNAFAHGEIVVDSSRLKATLFYYEGEKFSEELSDNYVQEILNNAEKVLHWLAEIESKYDEIRNVP